MGNDSAEKSAHFCAAEEIWQKSCLRSGRNNRGWISILADDARRALDEEGAGQERAIGEQRCRGEMRTADAAHGTARTYLPVLANFAFKNHGAMMADDHQFEWRAKAGSFRRP